MRCHGLTLLLLCSALMDAKADSVRALQGKVISWGLVTEKMPEPPMWNALRRAAEKAEIGVAMRNGVELTPPGSRYAGVNGPALGKGTSALPGSRQFASKAARCAFNIMRAASRR